MPDDLAHIDARVADNTSRIAALEKWAGNQRTSDAVRAERDKHLDERFDKIEESVKEIKGYLLRIVWILILGIMGGLITFILNGGLTVVPHP